MITDREDWKAARSPNLNTLMKATQVSPYETEDSKKKLMDSLIKKSSLHRFTKINEILQDSILDSSEVAHTEKDKQDENITDSNMDKSLLNLRRQNSTDSDAKFKIR